MKGIRRRVSKVPSVPRVSRGKRFGILKLMNKSNKSYRKLILWQRFIELLVITYRLTDKFSKSEEFVLKPQMRRAVISVLSNFVEGYLKESIKEKLHFMEIAETSLLELEAQSEICLILNYWTEKDFEEFDSKRSLAAYFLHQYKSKLPIK